MTTDRHNRGGEKSNLDKEYASMAGACARREMCCHEIRQRLERHGVALSAAEEIIGRLIKHGFIDERRYAEAYVSDKVSFSGWGRHKIRLGLITKRIPSEIVSDALKGIDEQVYTRKLLEAVADKARRLQSESYTDRGKMYRFLASRGYTSADIEYALGQWRKGFD